MGHILNLSIKTLILISGLFWFMATSAQTWETDLNQALSQAKNQDKKVLLVFSGSDWCAPCMKLDKNIWQSEEFKAHAKDNLVLLKADFPTRKKNQLPKQQQEKNNALAEKYNPKGYFPFVVLLDDSGNVINNLGYKSLSPKEYINAIYN
jgi:thioredoxin-related protein